MGEKNDTEKLKKRLEELEILEKEENTKLENLRKQKK